MASAFPIRPGNRREDGRPPDRPMIRAEGTGELVRLPSIDISRISFAAMGGSAEDLRGAFPENDVAYDVDSSDEDLDGMEAAVGRFERRAAERESLRAAAEANEDAARRLATEARETAAAVESLRQQRRRFEEARVVAERRENGVAVSGDAGEGRVAGSMPGDADRPSSSFADDEERELRDLRERRRRVDERIARLLEEAAGYDREREMVAGSNPTRDDEVALAVGDRERHRRMEEEEAAARKDDDHDDYEDDYDYAPRWKRRQEERWAREAEEAAAALERAESAAAGVAAPKSRERGERGRKRRGSRAAEPARFRGRSRRRAGLRSVAPAVDDASATTSRRRRGRSSRTAPRTSRGRSLTSRPSWTRGTRKETRCSTWRLRWIGSDASRRSCAPGRTSARGTTRASPSWSGRSSTRGSSWRTTS